MPDKPFACIIAGGRDVSHWEIVDHAMLAFPLTSIVRIVVSGGAIGVDTLGEKWASKRQIIVRRFPVTRADWDLFGQGAGHRRNQLMADVADALIAIPGCGNGTRDMIDKAIKKDLPVYIYDHKSLSGTWAHTPRKIALFP